MARKAGKGSSTPKASGDNAITRWALFSAEKLAAIGGVELAILKTHVVIEDVLKFVLAKRMGLPDEAFSELRIGFGTLVKVSLAGVSKPHLIGALRALNTARNHVSHRLESHVVSSKMRTFVQEVGRALGRPMSWPKDRDEQLKVLQEASGEAAVELIKIALRQMA